MGSLRPLTYASRVVRSAFLSCCAILLTACASKGPPPASLPGVSSTQAVVASETAPDEALETRVQVVGPRLFLLGTFDSRTGGQVQAALEADPAITTIVFTANGGSIDDDATLALGREVRRRGLATHLIADGVIASGGVSLFLAGSTRTIERGAKIGVHSWEHCWGDDSGQQRCKQAQDHERDDPGHDLHGDYTAQMLGSRDFYWFAIAAAPSDSIHWLTDAEVEANGLATNGLSEGRTAQPFGEDFACGRRGILGED